MNRFGRFLWAASVLCVVGSGFAWAAPGAVEYLGDLLDDRLVSMTQGWGELGIDTAVKPTDGRAAMPLRIKDQSYTRGLGHHAPGDLVFDLSGAYETFAADVGVQLQTAGVGSVVFQVFVDDEKRFDSGVMTDKDAAKAVSVSLHGAATLRLVVTDAGDGITCDCADWANARLIRGGAGKQPKAIPAFDIAPFAKYTSWDPHRMQGTLAKRIEEFPKEDVYLDSPVSGNGGLFSVPKSSDGTGCIGLQWAEPRLLREIGITGLSGIDNANRNAVHTEYWTGESPWQGKWIAIIGDIEWANGNARLPILRKKNPEFPIHGVDKIRWVFSPAAQPIQCRGLTAMSLGTWAVESFRLEFDGMPSGLRSGSLVPADVVAVQHGTIEAYNGALLSSANDSPVETPVVDWSVRQPLTLQCRVARSALSKNNRTVLRFTVPSGACAIGIDDVLHNGPVYVKDLGIYAVRASDPTTLSEYKKRIEGRKTVLQQVRELPDQTLEQALAITHNPIQDLGPTMLSLACDNRKIIAYRDGKVRFEPRGGTPSDKDGTTHPSRLLTPTFGAGDANVTARSLWGGWLPAPVLTINAGGLSYVQSTMVVPIGKAVKSAPQWLNTMPLCVVKFDIANTTNEAHDANLTLDFNLGAGPLEVVSRDGIIELIDAKARLACIEPTGAKTLVAESTNSEARLSGKLNPGETASCVAYIPLWDAPAGTRWHTPDARRLMQSFRDYWEGALADAAQIQTPDPVLDNIIRASQVHCLLAARNESDGREVAAWIASDRYGPLESEAHSVIYGMDLMGQSAFAQRSLDYFVKRYNPAGFLTTGYTLMGTGWHLWTLARHVALDQDTAWFKTVAPDVDRACRWIEAQREKTIAQDVNERPESGLVPPGVGADWNRFAYRFSVQSHYYAGLHEAAEMLVRADIADAGKLVSDSKSFHDDILRAYRWNQARTPAVPLSNGTYIPAYSGMLYGFGPTGDIFPGEDGNRSWCYDVELGSHHMVPLGVLPAKQRDDREMMDHMEDVMFLNTGMADYPSDKNHADWFNFGGFAKVQPFYARNAEICALNDDVKPFIRSYFNALAAQVSRENLSLWEHFHNTAAWNKTHETGWFLVQTRTMFVMERGDELWLAPFITDRWLDDGKEVSVENAPTRFGKVSYHLTSHVKDGYVRADISLGKGAVPDVTNLRVRDPEGRPIRDVKAIRSRSDNVSFDSNVVRINKLVGIESVLIYF